MPVPSQKDLKRSGSSATVLRVVADVFARP
jgi:hypothetical protein